MAHHDGDRDLYEILGVPSTASAAEITSAYRRRVRDEHPDSRQDAAADVSRLGDVLAAYQVLRDRPQRSSYDGARRPRASEGQPRSGVAIPVRHLAPGPSPGGEWLRVGPVHLDPHPNPGPPPAVQAIGLVDGPRAIGLLLLYWRR